MLTEYTGVYTTTDEIKARRVLGAIRPLGYETFGKSPVFLFKDGYYEIVFSGLLPEEIAHQFAQYAHVFADTNLVPLPLTSFIQEEI